MAKRRRRQYEYDVVLSFAGEDREYVEKVAKLLRARRQRVFYDDFEQADLWGKDLYVHLDEVYRHKGRYCLMFLSQHYAKKLWTNHERESAQARAFADSEAYILPVCLDNTKIPGIRPTTGYIDGSKMSPGELVKLVIKKLGPRPSQKSAKVATKNRSARQKHYSFPFQRQRLIIDGSVSATKKQAVLLDNVLLGLEKIPTPRAKKPELRLQFDSPEALERLHRIVQDGQPIFVLFDLHLDTFLIKGIKTKGTITRISLKQGTPFFGGISVRTNPPTWIQYFEPKNRDASESQATKQVVSKILTGSRIVLPKQIPYATHEKPPSAIPYKKIYISLKQNNALFKKVVRPLVAYTLLSTGIVSRIRRLELDRIRGNFVPVSLHAEVESFGLNNKSNSIQITERLVFR